jgi:hypothetical protein
MQREVSSFPDSGERNADGRSFIRDGHGDFPVSAARESAEVATPSSLPNHTISCVAQICLISVCFSLVIRLYYYLENCSNKVLRIYFVVAFDVHADMMQVMESIDKYRVLYQGQLHKSSHRSRHSTTSTVARSPFSHFSQAETMRLLTNGRRTLLLDFRRYSKWIRVKHFCMTRVQLRSNLTRDARLILELPRVIGEESLAKSGRCSKGPI